ncbi:hypothetical protein MRX96_058724 [Rhipicephalus microplus]
MGGFTCGVPGCYNNSTRDKGLGFYVFPKEQKLRETWIQRINRAGRGGRFSKFTPTTGHRVCGPLLAPYPYMRLNRQVRMTDECVTQLLMESGAFAYSRARNMGRYNVKSFQNIATASFGGLKSERHPN